MLFTREELAEKECPFRRFCYNAEAVSLHGVPPLETQQSCITTDCPAFRWFDPRPDGSYQAGITAGVMRQRGGGDPVTEENRRCYCGGGGMLVQE